MPHYNPNYKSNSKLSNWKDQNLRFVEKANNANERENFSAWWREQINIFGTEVAYYTNNYQTSGHDAVYGEHSTKTFSTSAKLVMGIELTEMSPILTKFGLDGLDDVTAFVHIDDYTAAIGSGTEPGVGDVFELSEYGNDRPGGRGLKKFEITQRLDQDISKINPLLGHYVWLITAKRFDYSYEPGLNPEKLSHQPSDSTQVGRLSGGENTATTQSTDINQIDAKSKEIWDYDAYGNSNDNVYGDY